MRTIVRFECTIVRMPDCFEGDSRTNHERMLAGDLYIADDPDIATSQQRAVRLAARYQAAYAEDAEAARPVLAELIGDLGAGAHIRPPLFVDYGTHITVGQDTFINYNLTALDVAPITIGRDCQIGPSVRRSPLPTPWNRSRAVTSWRPPSRSRSATTSGSEAEQSSWRE